MRICYSWTTVVIVRNLRFHRRLARVLHAHQLSSAVSLGIESAKANVSTIAAMKAANKELKRTLKKDLDIDEVEDLPDDMAELMDDFDQINEVFHAGRS
jgi:cobalamin-dependent methionine synthase I